MAEIIPAGLAPAEAVAHFERQGLRVGFDWRDTWHGQHSQAFTVAKMMQVDLLTDVHRQVQRIPAEGLTWPQFRDELEPRLRQAGWWGRQRMTDPLTGEEKLVQLGSVRRLKTIFDTNMRMGYAAGRWERIARNAATMPYLRYVAVRDGRTRPEHLKWNGTILRWDHPFWRTHYPPNGWFCRCTVQQLSEKDLLRRGWKVSPDPVIDAKPWTNKRTGEVVWVPDGVDPGFGYNVGIASQEARALQQHIERLQAAPPGLSRSAIGDGLRQPEFQEFLAGGKPGSWPVARLPEDLAPALGAPPEVVRLSAETAAKEARKHAEVTAASYQALQALLIEGEVIREGNRLVIDRAIAGTPWRAVVKATRDGRELYLLSYHRILERHRVTIRQRGTVLREEKKAPGGA